MHTLSMANTQDKTDVIIVGAGPAGVLCACELQGLGYRIHLIDAGESLTRIEGLSPRAVQLLQRKGLQSALAAVSPYCPRQVYWGSLSQTTTEQVNGEYLVARPQFDALLRDAAQAQGVNVIKQRVTALHSDDDQVQVSLDNGAVLAAAFVVNARGRRANQMAHEQRAPKNLALAAWIKTSSTTAQSAICALEQGWLWLAQPGSSSASWVQLMLDAHEVPEKSAFGAYIEQAYQQAFQQHAELVSEPVIRGADFRLNSSWRLVERILPIGDAACAFDPLSGHGMFWAFSSALSAAAVVNTVLKDSCLERWNLCEQFYRQRQTETFWRQARVGRDFYQIAGQSSSFWQQRRQWPDQQPIHTPKVHQAAISVGPAIRANQVEAVRQLQLPDEASPVAWFGEIGLVDTLEACWAWQKQTRQVLSLEVFSRLCIPRVSQGVVIQCWNWLQKHQLLERPIPI